MCSLSWTQAFLRADPGDWWSQRCHSAHQVDYIKLIESIIESWSRKLLSWLSIPWNDANDEGFSTYRSVVKEQFDHMSLQTTQLKCLFDVQ